MRKAIAFLGLTFLFLTACNLAGDVTPPPVLATQQAFLPEPAAPPSTSIPVDEPASIAAISPPEQIPDLMKGGLIYAEKCAPCHGDTGMGDGSMSGNLEITPAQLGATDIGRSAVPTEWYEIVTDGRMNRFMPPFSSLSDSERWDVVGYALSLSTLHSELDHGEERYAELCADCHGEEGEKVQGGETLSDPAFMATLSLEDMAEVVAKGSDTMPAFQGVIDEDDQWAIAAYIRSIATVGEFVEVVEEVDHQGEILRRITGSVITGTQEMAIPENLEVALLAFDGDQPVLTETTTADRSGGFEFGGLEIVPGRIFGAFIEHEGVRYYSTAVHFLEDASIFELPIVVFESTHNQDNLEVERVHLVFDYVVEDLVNISELWLISNTGDTTIVSEEGSGILEIPLPDGYQDLRLTDATSFAEPSITDDSVIVQDPILPGETLDLVFSFTLPYERSREFQQPMTIPASAIVVLTAEDAPEVLGEGVEDQGVRDMGGVRFRTYAIEPPAADEALAFDLSGRHPASASLMDSSNLVISIGLLGLALVLVGIGWRYVGSRSPEKGEEPVIEMDANRDKGTLLHAIAALDDVFEAGEISEKEYKKQRSELKDELSGLMTNEHD
jgi:mono/diheme cytochrome c family protein